MINCLCVGIGGFLGSVCRYLVGLIPLKEQTSFPFKTFAINIAGAFLLGLLSAYAAKNPNTSPRLLLLLKVGVCGGFTTFSTFAYESTSLFTDGKSAIALTYVLLSITLGILAVYASQLIIHS
ncbi:MAG: fluoride efflux transporter CrcB [Solobacterium sp.]|nr:fluoride efflux transporter CrcB [Solobacterium sp.]MCH4205351.1 fluoride efflux transporter CrcB [Solobacterium sp.]MCH4226952.1 fluoride efflux transporter CrcB [Solobacterium sp.]MCH4282256.1 fluoride efflux transporter CrcB [Solobacterium sp.]